MGLFVAIIYITEYFMCYLEDLLIAFTSFRQSITVPTLHHEMQSTEAKATVDYRETL